MMNQSNLAPRRGTDCLSDFALDRLRTGELDGASEGERVSAHLRACKKCRGRQAEIAAVAAPALDLSTLSAAAERRADRRTWRIRALWLTPVFAAAAIALLVPWRDFGERSKGSSWHLGVVAQYPNGKVGAVSPGAALAPGDRLRFEVSAPSEGFVSIISLDAKGAVTPFVPAAGDTAKVHKGQRQLLDGAVRLDDAMGPERLLLLACPRPMAVALVVAAGRAALARAQGRPDSIGNLDLPCTQTSFWIRKEVRP